MASACTREVGHSARLPEIARPAAVILARRPTALLAGHETVGYLSRPHISTFRLVSMVEKMRASIHELGGEVRFETRVDDIEIDQGKVRSLKLSNGETLLCDHVVLAVGHSARDTFQMLHDRGVFIEAKPFSLGFRI